MALITEAETIYEVAEDKIQLLYFKLNICDMETFSTDTQLGGKL